MRRGRGDFADDHRQPITIWICGDVSRGVTVDWTMLISVAAIAIAGILIGSVIAHKVKEQKLKTAFGWFVLLMGSGILAEQIFQF